MGESPRSKVTWIVVGAIIGGVISLSFDRWIKPLFTPEPLQPKIRVSASSDQSGEAAFLIQNEGDAAAEDVSLTLWATSVFAPRTDITELEHLGGVSDAECEHFMKLRQLTGAGPRPNPINTASQAGLVECVRINPGEKWHGRVRFSISEGSGGVPGLMVHIKGRDISENQLARFEEGIQ